MKKNLLPAVAALICVVLSGCSPGSSIDKARRSAEASAVEYEKAVSVYKSIIAASPSDNAVRAELGMLYYLRGDNENAIEFLRPALTFQTAKALTIAYFRTGDYTAALESAKAVRGKDDELRYYHGLICEKLNLFDQALKEYSAVENKDFRAKARSRAATIEKERALTGINDLDPETAGVIAAAPSADKYPQAGALILLSDESVEVSPDNKAVYRLHYIVKILNERGKEYFSEAPVEYDSTDEKIKLEYARTIKPDGTVVDIGSKHVRDVSKYLNFPLYSNARVLIISFPEITEGAVIEYEVTLHKTELINKKDFVVALPLQTREPVVAGRFVLRAPSALSVNIKAVNQRYNDFGAVTAPKVSDISGVKTYSWEFANIPQIIPESAMPPVHDINPTVLISSFESWDSVYKWWIGLARDKISADGPIRDQVAALTAGKQSAAEKAGAIYNFCAQKIRYVAVEYGQAGYEPHKAGDIFGNKYGDCKDQAVLLVTMLREAGLNAWPVLIPTRDSFDMREDFPAVLFNHAIACVELDGRLIFMDPTADTCSFGDLPSGDQDRNVLIVKDDGFLTARTPLFPPGHNKVVQELDMTVLDDESVTGERSIYTYGAYDQAQRGWLLYTVPDAVKEKITAKIQDISVGGLLTDYSASNAQDLNRPVVLRYSFAGQDFMVSAGQLRILPALASVDMNAVSKAARLYPVEHFILDLKETINRIKIPPVFRVKYLPPRISERSKWMDFDAVYEFKGDSVVFTQAARIKQRNVPAEEYQDYKKFVEKIGKQLKQRVVLERKI